MMRNVHYDTRWERSFAQKSVTVTIKFSSISFVDLFSFFRYIRRVQVLRVISRAKMLPSSVGNSVTKWPRAWTSRVKFIEIISIYGYRSPWMTFTKLPFGNSHVHVRRNKTKKKKTEKILQSRVRERNIPSRINSCHCLSAQVHGAWNYQRQLTNRVSSFFFFF